MKWSIKEEYKGPVKKCGVVFFVVLFLGCMHACVCVSHFCVGICIGQYIRSLGSLPIYLSVSVSSLSQTHTHTNNKKQFSMLQLLDR